MFKNLTVGKKLACGFGVVLVALAAVVTFSYTGVGSIVSNATEVIYGNQLEGVMTQKELDHLNWAAKVNTLLTDENVTTLEAETDDHKCGFGQWLYSDLRKQTEEQLPALASVLKEIEEPHRKLHDSAVQIKQIFVHADPTLPGTLAARQVDHLNWAGTIRDCFLANDKALNVQLDPTQCALGKWLNSPEARKIYENGTAEFKQTWDKLVATHKQLHDSAKDIGGKYVQIHKGLRNLLKDRLLDHKDWAHKVTEAVIESNANLGVETDHTKCAFGKFLASEECANCAKGFSVLEKAISDVKEPHQHLHESAVAISKALAGGAEGKAQAEKIFKDTTLPALKKVSECFTTVIDAETRLNDEQTAAMQIFAEKTVPLLHQTLTCLNDLKTITERAVTSMQQAKKIYAEHTVPSLHKVQELLSKARQTVKEHIMTQEVMLQAAQATKRNVGIVGTIGIILGVVLAVLIARGLVSALKRAIEALMNGSQQVSAAAGQVSAASQSLAEGATEQAAGLEETSSSLEEMSSMTKQSADNAQQANSLASEARQAADKGAESMQKMNQAITDIQKSSDETAKIIKVIDEIAFQTNLLALNAAVEAARAGEAGKGFAVVAEEVRNLAMRSAEAAKNTASMIEESVKNSKNGVEISTEVSKVLEEIVQSVGKTTELVGEIAAASQEQAQGIDQINTAISQMDKVTQQNAASAEESASASEELSAQAGSMNDIVNELVALVGGANKTAGAGSKGLGHHLNLTVDHDATRKVHEVFGKRSGLLNSDRTFHQIADGAKQKSQNKPLTKAAADKEKAIPLKNKDAPRGESFEQFNA